MKVGIIGAGTMGQGIAKAFAQVDGYEVALCDIKQEWAEGGKAKIQKGYAKLVEKGKLTQEAVDAILAKITPGLKEDLCADCDLIVEAGFERGKAFLRIHILLVAFPVEILDIEITRTFQFVRPDSDMSQLHMLFLFTNPATGTSRQFSTKTFFY